MMTIDEAITQAEKTAQRNEKAYTRFRNHGGTVYDEKAGKCLKRANECRQIAEWLKKLKRYEFEIRECRRILTYPSPYVSYVDEMRARHVLETFESIGMGLK